MKKNYLFLVFVLYAHLLFAQKNTIQGKVTDLQGEPLPGAIVICETKDTTNSTSNFSITNGQGEWQIEMIKSSHYHLEVRYLGYEKKVISFSSDSASYFTIQLKEEATTLEEVVVSAYKNAIRQSGDSIIYDLYKYTTGYEYDLKEVLDKLPGISVTSDGDIFFNGRRIDQILVESKDLLGNQHKLAGGLFLADMVEAVHIIENYKNQVENGSFEKSDKVALDIQLTDDALNTWGGKIETAAGYKNRAEVGADAFNINHKISATLFTRWNNIADPILSLADYLSIQPSKKRTLQNLENANELKGQIFQFRDDLVANNDGLIAANVLIEPSQQHQTKVILLYGLLNRDHESELNRVYYNTENTTLEGSAIENNTTTLIKPSINHLWRPSDRISLELELPFSHTRFAYRNHFEGNLNNIATQSDNSSTEQTNETLPLTTFSYRINENWYVNSQLSYLNSSKEQALLVAEVEDLFDTNTASLAIDMAQKNSVSSMTNQLQHTLRDSSLIAFNTSISFQNFQVDSKSDLEDSFEWNYHAARSMSSIGGNYTYRKENFYADLQFDGKIAHTDVNESSAQQRLYHLEFEAKKDFSVKTHLLLNMKIDQNPIDLNALNKDSIVVDNRELSTSAIDPETKMTKREIMLSYVRLKFTTTSQLFVAASIHRTTNKPFYEPEVIENYVINRWILSEFEDNFSVNTIYKSPLLFNKLRASANFLLNNSRINLTDDSQIAINQSRIRMGLRTKLTGRFNYELSVMRQVIGNGRSFNQFVIDQLKFQHRYDTKKLHLDYEISQQTLSAASVIQNRIWQLNINGQYKLGDFRITLRANDLLNLTGAKVTQRSFEFNYLDHRDFIRFPGYLLAGLSYHF